MKTKDRDKIDSIISRSIVCRLAVSENDTPYIIPMNFGYDGEFLYFHSSQVGKKIDAIKKNIKVCFEFDIDSCPIESDKACNWDMKYESVVGFGEASFIEDMDSKRDALKIIVKQYSDKSFELPTERIEKVAIIKVSISEISGKQSS